MVSMRLVFAGLSLGMFAPGTAQTRTATGISSTVTLTEMRDRLRPLLIFAPTSDDARLLEQVRALNAHAAEAAERTLMTVVVPEQGNSPTAHRLAAENAAEARRRFHVSAGKFVVVLVGKDGDEKLRSDKPISFEKLRGTIDAMPMRQEEMKTKGSVGAKTR